MTPAEIRHLDTDALHAGLDHIRASPAEGPVALIVQRPVAGERVVLDTAELSLDEGLVGDSWSRRGSNRTEDGGPHPDMQLNVMNARILALVAQSSERMPLAGDQLILDMDLSHANLPAGTRLAIGDTVIEVTEQPHSGCPKFTERFGVEAHRFVNSEVGKELRLRGLNAKVVVPGTIRRGDMVRKDRSAH